MRAVPEPTTQRSHLKASTLAPQMLALLVVIL